MRFIRTNYLLFFLSLDVKKVLDTVTETFSPKTGPGEISVKYGL